MTKGKKSPQKAVAPIDTVWGTKRRRGRPVKMAASEIKGRADNYRWTLGQVWDRLREPLLTAQDEAGVTKAFVEHAQPYEREFVPAIGTLILKVVRERRFPKRRDAQVGFLADSLAGRGAVSPRRSRDICARERAKERARSPYKIIRHEYYVECECGYKGPARDGVCRKCGAQIPLSLEIMPGFGFG